MNEENEQSQTAQPRKEFSEDILHTAIDALKARGDSTRRMACMQLPAHLFNDLCGRLLDRTATVKATAEWLAGQTDEAPTRSSVERFSAALFQEYQAALYRARRQRVETYTAAVTEGDPEAATMAMNARLTELVTDELMDIDDLAELGDNRLNAITSAANVVARVKFGKKILDVRVAALNKQIEERDAAIAMKESANVILKQRIQQVPDRCRAIEDKLAHVEKLQAQGKKVDASIYAAIREELTRVREVAA